MILDWHLTKLNSNSLNVIIQTEGAEAFNQQFPQSLINAKIMAAYGKKQLKVLEKSYTHLLYPVAKRVAGQYPIQYPIPSLCDLMILAEILSLNMIDFSLGRYTNTVKFIAELTRKFPQLVKVFDDEVKPFIEEKGYKYYLGQTILNHAAHL